MRLSNSVRWLAVAAALAVTGDVAAQSTATLAGRVMDESGAALSGVQVVVTNQNSGSQNGALSQSDGRFLVVGLRAGGPYGVEARMLSHLGQLAQERGLPLVLEFQPSARNEPARNFLAEHGVLPVGGEGGAEAFPAEKVAAESE